jgi:hypothetical protein
MCRNPNDPQFRPRPTDLRGRHRLALVARYCFAIPGDFRRCLKQIGFVGVVETPQLAFDIQVRTVPRPECIWCRSARYSASVGVALYLMAGIRHHNVNVLHLTSGMPLGPEPSIVPNLWTA